jgi:preprotein translocase subunit YajC
VEGIVGLLPFLLIFVVIYLFMIKPAKKRQQQTMETQNSLRPGMEVRTVAGLFARVSEVEDDAVVLEIAPGVHCRYLKSAIVAVLNTDEAEDVAADRVDGDEDDEHDDGTTVVDLGKIDRADETADAVGADDKPRKD